MTREEALQRIVDNNFAGEYGFDMQILVDCMVVAREKILNSQFPSEDCISRAEARKHIYQRLWESALNNVGYECKAEDVFMDIADNRLSTWISEIPSIQPKPKTGHWIWQKEDIYRCSECGNDIRVKEVMHEPQYVCCPICETKMQAESEDKE